MASYFIAGKADDPAFARAEFAAKLIESACPSVIFHFEMRHPDEWKEFITSVFRKYDFDGYNDEFSGPLVWTHEGNLIGSSTDFVQKICIEKFGIKKPPSITDPMFKQIASDNLKQVKLQQQRARCLPFAERLDSAHRNALSASLVSKREFKEKHTVVVQGAPWEVYVSAAPYDTSAGAPVYVPAAAAAEEAGAPAPSESAAGVEAEEAMEPAEGATDVAAEAASDAPVDAGKAIVDARLRFATAGADRADSRLQSHSVLLHPSPVARRQMVLVPKHMILEREATEGESATVEIAPSSFGTDPHEDLGLQAFTAAMEVLRDVGGVAVWQGMRGLPEYRDALETHLQILPFPVVEGPDGAESALRFPLELYLERMLSSGTSQLPFFPFRHTLQPLDIQEGVRASEAARAALEAYERARRETHPKDCVMLAFTRQWLLLLPLHVPDKDHPRYEAWLRLPPPPPCALCGVVICPELRPDFPETSLSPGLAAARLEPVPFATMAPAADAEGNPLHNEVVLPPRVSNRAEEEGIPEESAEYAVAVREVRIDTRIMREPIGVLGHWGFPLQA